MAEVEVEVEVQCIYMGTHQRIPTLVLNELTSPMILFPVGPPHYAPRLVGFVTVYATSADGDGPRPEHHIFRE